MPDAIDAELCSSVISAVNAVRTFIRDRERDLGYVSRLEVPKFKLNSNGWPSITKGSVISGGPDEPINWNWLFGTRQNSLVKFSVADVPELQHVVDYAISNPHLIRRIDPIGEHIEDPGVKEQERGNAVIRIVTTIASRAEALSATDPAEVLNIYLDYERGLLSNRVKGDLLFPIVLRRFELDGDLPLNDSVALEQLDEGTQRARAVSGFGVGGINPYLISAATHAVVLKNREFDNSEGPIARQIRTELARSDAEEVERVCQVIQILTGVELGYAQVCLRPIGWASSWIHDLPPIEAVQTIRRYPLLLDDTGWNKVQPTIDSDSLERLPSVFAALSSTNPRAQLAARRLFQTSLRDLREDIVLDACIGIEALLGEEHDELVHRMGLRAASALTSRGWSPHIAYDTLKRVYSHRSKIVHGTEPKTSTMTLGTSTQQYTTSSVAVLLLRELLESHLTGVPPWTPGSLDEHLFGALAFADKLAEEEQSDRVE